MSADLILEYLTAAALIVGAFFTLVGSYGLLKLDQPLSRLHAPTKASTLGVGSLLAASMLHAFASGDPSLHEVLIMAFLFVTAPITGHFIAKTHMHRQRRDSRPPSPPEAGPEAPHDPTCWATYAETRPEKG